MFKLLLSYDCGATWKLLDTDYLTVDDAVKDAFTSRAADEFRIISIIEWEARAV